MALDDGQGAVAGVLHVLGVLDSGQPEPGLLPGEAGELAPLEELALVEAASEVEDRGALHDGVVEVEEGGGQIVPGDGEGVRGGLGGRFGLRLRRVDLDVLVVLDDFRIRRTGQSGLAGGLGRGLASPARSALSRSAYGGEPSQSGHDASIATVFGSSRTDGMRRRELCGAGVLRTARENGGP
ncbi:hypothetical protein GCM10020254_38830 [Streptomyces goshikiensis]